MKKKIAILGSTGSIGKTLLKIIKKNKKDFNILLLTANKNYKQILNQTKTFNVQNVILEELWMVYWPFANKVSRVNPFLDAVNQPLG